MPEQLIAHHAATYLRIANHLRLDIQSGRLRPGRNLPSERQLALHFGVHRQTVRAALQQLRDQDHVASDHLGTYALPHRSGRPVRPSLDRGPGAAFPGSFLRPETAAVAAGVLRTGPVDHRAAEAFRLDLDAIGLVYEHSLHAPDGGVLQSSLSWFAPELPRQIPQLGLAARKVMGSTADLGDLFVWAAMAGLRLRAGDTIQPLPAGAESPGGLAVRRRLTDQYDRLLISTAFRVVEKGTELTYSTPDFMQRLAITSRNASPVRRLSRPSARSWRSGHC